MSLILDALRKMDKERRGRRSAAAGIRNEVLRYRAAANQPEAKPYLLAAVGVALLLAGVCAGMLLKGNRATTLARSEAPGTSMATAALPPADPAAAATSRGADSIATMAPVAPAMVPPAQPEAKAAPSAAALASVSAAAADAGRRPAAKRQKSAPAASRGTVAFARLAKAPRGHVDLADDAPSAVPDITISGIAWQDERNLRRAVLNGTLVGEGAEVAGARVVEIKENRVRLSRGGHVFDVQYSSSLSSR